MRESEFQHDIIREIKQRFPGCIVLKNDAGYIQGIPDLLVLYNDKWAALECKKEKGAHLQPNQEYYLEKMKQMSFSALIFPENRKEIIDELEQALGL